MTQLSEQVQIRIYASTQSMQYSFSQMGEYFDLLKAVCQKWFPIVSSAHASHVKVVRMSYRRKTKARRRRGRKR